MTRSTPEGTSLSGWCSTGYCLPGPLTRGCPGTFDLVPDCVCTCHSGEPPERAMRVLEASRRWVEEGSIPPVPSGVVGLEVAEPDVA